MADRGASAAFLTELAKAAHEPFWLFELRLDVADGSTVYATDCHRNIVFGGNTYLANGNLLSWSGIQESAELRIKSCSVSLSGVDQSWISTVLTANYVDRRLLVYKGFVTADADVMVVDPIAVFDGRVDGCSVDEDPEAGTCTVSIAAADEWVAFERLSGRHTCDSEQKVFFPTDTGLSRVSQINVPIKWGAA